MHPGHQVRALSDRFVMTTDTCVRVQGMLDYYYALVHFPHDGRPQGPTGSRDRPRILASALSTSSGARRGLAVGVMATTKTGSPTGMVSAEIAHSPKRAFGITGP